MLERTTIRVGEAPFWKKEATPEGERWVDARESDDKAKARWGEG